MEQVTKKGRNEAAEDESGNEKSIEAAMAHTP